MENFDVATAAKSLDTLAHIAESALAVAGGSAEATAVLEKIHKELCSMPEATREKVVDASSMRKLPDGKGGIMAYTTRYNLFVDACERK